MHSLRFATASSAHDVQFNSIELTKAVSGYAHTAVFQAQTHLLEGVVEDLQNLYSAIRT